MAWQPVSEVKIWDKINTARERMNIHQQRLWHIIVIVPGKWVQNPWGDPGDGFWAVALIGRMVVWYNDIEEGFNRSDYDVHGHIKQYRCNQDELKMSIQKVLNAIYSGHDLGPFCGPPESGVFQDRKRL